MKDFRIVLTGRHDEDSSEYDGVVRRISVLTREMANAGFHVTNREIDLDVVKEPAAEDDPQPVADVDVGIGDVEGEADEE